MKRIVYGINPVTEVFRAAKDGRARIERLLLVKDRAEGAGIKKILDAAYAVGLKAERLSRGEVESLAKSTAHQGVVLLLKDGYPYLDIDDVISIWKDSGERAFFLILDSIEDPQNLGSLIRTAHTAGVHGIIIPKDRAAEVTATVAKASAGATEHSSIARVTNITAAIKRLKDEGVWVMGIEADSDADIYSTELSGDIAIVIGSEGQGIRRLVKKECDLCLKIPMKGRVNSLNAAQAGAVALFEAVRQRCASSE